MTDILRQKVGTHPDATIRAKCARQALSASMFSPCGSLAGSDGRIDGWHYIGTIDHYDLLNEEDKTAYLPLIIRFGAHAQDADKREFCFRVCAMSVLGRLDEKGKFQATTAPVLPEELMVKSGVGLLGRELADRFFVLTDAFVLSGDANVSSEISAKSKMPKKTAAKISTSPLRKSRDMLLSQRPLRSSFETAQRPGGAQHANERSTKRPVTTDPPRLCTVDEDTKIIIDRWLAHHGLNELGDALGTDYSKKDESSIDEKVAASIRSAMLRKCGTVESAFGVIQALSGKKKKLRGHDVQDGLLSLQLDVTRFAIDRYVDMIDRDTEGCISYRSFAAPMKRVMGQGQASGIKRYNHIISCNPEKPWVILARANSWMPFKEEGRALRGWLKRKTLDKFGRSRKFKRVGANDADPRLPDSFGGTRKTAYEVVLSRFPDKPWLEETDAGDVPESSKPQERSLEEAKRRLDELKILHADILAEKRKQEYKERDAEKRLLKVNKKNKVSPSRKMRPQSSSSPDYGKTIHFDRRRSPERSSRHPGHDSLVHTYKSDSSQERRSHTLSKSKHAGGKGSSKKRRKKKTNMEDIRDEAYLSHGRVEESINSLNKYGYEINRILAETEFDNIHGMSPGGKARTLEEEYEIDIAAEALSRDATNRISRQVEQDIEAESNAKRLLKVQRAEQRLREKERQLRRVEKGLRKRGSKNAYAQRVSANYFDRVNDGGQGGRGRQASAHFRRHRPKEGSSKLKSWSKGRRTVEGAAGIRREKRAEKAKEKKARKKKSERDEAMDVSQWASNITDTIALLESENTA